MRPKYAAARKCHIGAHTLLSIPMLCIMGLRYYHLAVRAHHIQAFDFAATVLINHPHITGTSISQGSLHAPVSNVILVRQIRMCAAS